MIRAVLVDDEPPARRRLRHLLSRESDIEVVGEAASGAEAIAVLNQQQPDLAFLDIQLPDCTGFDIVEALPETPPIQIVFVTAHDTFALKAFEVHAVDYLLKPVDPARFTQALAHVRRAAEPVAIGLAQRLENLVATLRTNPTYARRLLIQENDRSFFLDVSRIDWIEAARNYACIHSGTSTQILRGSLESLLSKLDPKLFRRISRSHIINVERIAEVRSWFHGDQKIRLKDGTELNWSRRYRASSLEELERA